MSAGMGWLFLLIAVGLLIVLLSRRGSAAETIGSVLALGAFLALPVGVAMGYLP